ncbi:MOB2 (YFL034C-B) [Zygosaccharomyces parabailii]|uniref:CBK1 kinase activator protein MOB2 n=1 Tax=Zygosaccharomyces bailii (strain CLIB 213 / ATCC 58445 / CBS 680 / BCRC 21525 / NBRC 1098 / NCYC 1416 / NRRL Y-2227) TaxID=1333698 RepID=A0A8J2XAU1_ZYGB2|nr:MOB2 (YFL034C-B) [Zygosaccharomyces parabailii]CDF91881.1 ZYBA0S15-00694g1_1 [Zygosaccharomyces bailii CLIB 213]
MSFFNFKGFGRNSKKNKNANNNIGNVGSAPMNTIYSSPHSSSSKLSLRKNHSPSRHSQHSTQQSQQQSNQNSTSERPESQQIMFLSEPFVRTALVKGSFKTIVQLPKYVDIGDWIALNVFEFFTNLNQFYGVIAEYVTPDAYPTMNAGPHTDYLWLDANNRQVSLPASQYIDLALTWIDNKVNDKNLFPTKNNLPFPQMFLRDVQRIMVQMFRIFAHIYHHHFDKIIHLSLEAHWNSFFAHFISFSKEFNIIDRKEMYPLLPLIENLEYQGKII